tara:strand:+ start:386 stop:661 length:276 start_codon:yes stop_codon:yes gene_type:complete
MMTLNASVRDDSSPSSPAKDGEGVGPHWTVDEQGEQELAEEEDWRYPNQPPKPIDGQSQSVPGDDTWEGNQDARQRAIEEDQGWDNDGTQV